MENKKYTIKDIARMAGVSTGTVDRVMHERGEVSEASREKVKKILEEIDYQPNMFAIGLAAKRKYEIYCLIPSYKKNDYWYSVVQGIEKAAAELKPFNISMDFIFYSHSDKVSYIKSQQKIMEQLPDAVLIAPNFKDETYAFTTSLEKKNIPYVFIDVNIEGAKALKYIGQDSYQSGYIAAKILMRQYNEDQELLLFLSNFKENPAEFQMQRRLEGFMKFLSENKFSPQIHEIIIDRDSQEKTINILDNFFQTHIGTYMGVVFNSRVYQIGKYLQDSQYKITALIGYDLLPENVNLMKEGYVNYLIGQRPRLQGYCGVKALTDKIMLKKEIEPVKYMPIDILMKDNIDYYFELI